MLSVFPEILFLAPLSAVLIRASAASVLAVSAYTHWRVPLATKTLKVFAVIEIAIAAFLASGTYTQPAALAGITVVALWFALRNVRPMPKSTTFLLLVLCISLILTGAGPLSFDLPL